MKFGCLVPLAAIVGLVGMAMSSTHDSMAEKKRQMIEAAQLESSHDEATAGATSKDALLYVTEPLPVVATEPEPAPEPMTVEEEFKLVAVGVTEGWNASDEILDIDADTLYHVIRPEICGLIFDQGLSVALVESVMSGEFRKLGDDQELADNKAAGLVNVSTEYGCSEYR